MKKRVTDGLRRTSAGRRGGALLAVLWLSAALSAIAFTLALTVRSELERSSAAIDSVRAYYLAEGAIERFVMQLSSSTYVDPKNSPPSVFQAGQRRMRWELPAGVVDLEITGENGKLNVLDAQPAALARLFVLLGIDEGRSQQIAAGIAARRQASRAIESSFSGPTPSFIQLEDLLTVPGVTTDVFYGWWVSPGAPLAPQSVENNSPAAGPAVRLALRGGIASHLTLLDGGAVNVNYASPEVLRAIGVPEGPLMNILQAREGRVIENVASFGAGVLPSGAQLVGGGSEAYTVRATAQLSGRPVRRTVAAVIRYGRDRFEAPLGIIRWYASGN